MKKLKITIATLSILIAFSCKDAHQDAQVESNEVEQISEKEQQTAEVSFSKDMTGKLWNNYLKVKTALVESNAEKVQTAAQSLSQNFSEQQEELKSIVQQMASTDDLEKQRELFSKINEQAESLFKNELNNGTIYKQYCPMAFNNTGGYWFSDVDQIRNPYFGDRMLKCGNVAETIKK
ncbi:DUF3347 domain-containing protein [Nonlabens sp. MIC269]|nr:DUF3347 domain-containing protein [Nonlabens sp. MIC269]